MKPLIVRAEICAIELRYLAGDTTAPDIAKALTVLARLLEGIIGDIAKDVKRQH